MDESRELTDERHAEPPEACTRRLRITLAVSLFVHAGLIAMLGPSGAFRLIAAPQGEQRLQVRLVQGAATEGLVPDPPRATDIASEFESRVPAAESAAPATLTALAEGPPEPALLDSSPVVAAPSASDVALVVTTGEAARFVLPKSDAEAPAAHATADAAFEREELLERIGEWIHKLEASDPRREQFSWQQDGVPYTAVLTRRGSAGATDLERYDIEIETPATGGRRKTGLSLKRLAFSHYTQFVDRWDSEIQLHDDEIEGRFHANSPIIISYDSSATPRFLGKVTTAGRGFQVGNTFGRKRREEIFQGGLETNVGRIALADARRPLVDLDETGEAELRRFDRDARIRFHADGSYAWSDAETGDMGGVGSLPDGPACLAGAPGVVLYVSGTVRGQVLVYSDRRIVIEGDLRYARDPLAIEGADDMLGLVSEGQIEIARADVTGRGDLQVFAAVYARRRFAVTDVNAPRAGTLRIYGSLTAGSLTETEPRYATRIEYDRRFEERRPPGFPMVARFELEDSDPSSSAQEGSRSN